MAIWEHLETITLMRHIENGPRGTRMLTHEVRFSGFREAKKLPEERCASKCLASAGCQPTASHSLLAF
jgi:hypothetical protein